MIGDLDEVRVYQKPLSSAQIKAVHSTSAALRAALVEKSGKAGKDGERSQSVAAPKRFQYGHITADSCRTLPPKRPSAVAYSGSYSLCYSYLVGEREMVGPPGAQAEKGRWTAQLTVVFHSYVGYSIGKANEYTARPSDVPIGRSLKSRQIRMQIVMGKVKATGSMLDDWDGRLMRVYAGATGCTSDYPDGIGATVGNWAPEGNEQTGEIQEIILDRTTDDNAPDPAKTSSCSVNPNVRYTTNAQWVKEDLSKSLTFRCDSSREILLYSSGCVLTSLRPVLIFTENNSNEIFSARHVWTALYNSAQTWPKEQNGPRKSIPGGFLPYAPGCPVGACLEKAERTVIHGPTGKLLSDAHRDVAIPQCRRIRPYWKPDSCDEFPFATTYQGAAYAGYNYSVAIIPGDDNCSSGSTTNQWYQRNRILDKDKFWVDVVRQGYHTPESGAPGSIASNPTPDNISLATCTIDGIS
jgi:hypothetical protein